MRAVIGTVISSEPVTLEEAAATLSNFTLVATGSRPELAVFSARASRAFAELLDFHRNLLSPHPAAAGDLHNTGNRADAAQTGAGIGIGYESPSLGVNRAAGLGAGSVVEREIDVKRKKMKERAEAAVENVSDERDWRRKKRKERVEVAEGNRSREVELVVQHEETEEMNAGVDGNVAPSIDNERDGKWKKRKERVAAAEGLAVRHEELEEITARLDDNVAPGIANERDEKRKKGKERSRDAALAMSATNRPKGGAVYEKRYEGVIDDGALPRIVDAVAVDNGVVPGIDNEGGGKKKRKKKSRDAKLAEGLEGLGMNAVSRIEGVDDERDGKRAMLKERALPAEVSMVVVQPEAKVEKDEFGEERFEERRKKKSREKNKYREDDIKVNDSVVQVEVKLEKEEFGEEGRSVERRNREREVDVDGGGKKRKHGEVNVDGGGKKRKHLDNKREEVGFEGRREPHNKSAELGDQSEPHHKKKKRKRE